MASVTDSPTARCLFGGMCGAFSFCQRWLDEGEELTRRYNQQFIQRLRQQEFDLFGGSLPPAAQPTESQLEALLLNEPRVLVQGIAGSGKTILPLRAPHG
ncbi:hypothetical protein PCI56_09320 [Plesiomonas shigelloides subsp. oncorhynchi]|nr:hypothetical protein [Plesiomonas shigelloides]